LSNVKVLGQAAELYELTTGKSPSKFSDLDVNIEGITENSGLNSSSYYQMTSQDVIDCMKKTNLSGQQNTPICIGYWYKDDPRNELAGLKKHSKVCIINNADSSSSNRYKELCKTLGGTDDRLYKLGSFWHYVL
jgi:hypothetical protein